MSVPSNVGSKAVLDIAWQNARGHATFLKQRCAALKAKSLAGPVTSSEIIDMVNVLRDLRLRYIEFIALPGIVAHVQAEMGVGFDVTAEYAALITQIEAVGVWVMNNFPKDAATQCLLERSFDAQANLVDQTFSTAQLATFRNVLDTLIALID